MCNDKGSTYFTVPFTTPSGGPAVISSPGFKILLARCMGNLGGFTRKATRNFLNEMAANVEKSPLIRFIDELDFKQIPVSVKRKKKIGMSIRTNSN